MNRRKKDLCLRPGNHLLLGGEEVFVVSVSGDNRTAQVQYRSGKTQTVSVRENPQQGRKALEFFEHNDPYGSGIHSGAFAQHGTYIIYRPGGYSAQPSSDFYHLVHIPTDKPGPEGNALGRGQELLYHYDPKRLEDYAEKHDEDTYLIPTRQPESKSLNHRQLMDLVGASYSYPDAIHPLHDALEESPDPNHQELAAHLRGAMQSGEHHRIFDSIQHIATSLIHLGGLHREYGLTPPEEQEGKSLVRGKSLRFGGGRIVTLPQLRKAVRDEPGKKTSSRVEEGTHPREPGTQQGIGAGKGDKLPGRRVFQHGPYRLDEYHYDTPQSRRRGQRTPPRYFYYISGPQGITSQRHENYEDALQEYQETLHHAGLGLVLGEEEKSLRRRGKAAKNPQEMTQHLGGVYRTPRGIQRAGELEKGARQNFRIIHHRDGVRLAEVHAGTRVVPGMPLQTVRQFVVGALGIEPTYHQDYESALNHYRSLLGETGEEEKSLRRRGKAVPREEPQLRSTHVEPGTHPLPPGAQERVNSGRFRGKERRPAGRTIHRHGQHKLQEYYWSETPRTHGGPNQVHYSYAVVGPNNYSHFHNDYESAANHYQELTGADLGKGDELEEKSLRRKGKARRGLPSEGKAVEDKPDLRSTHVEPGTYPQEPGVQRSIGTGKGSRTYAHTIHRFRGYRIAEVARGLPDHHHFIVQHEQSHNTTQHATLEEARHQLASNLGWDMYLSGHPRRSVEE